MSVFIYYLIMVLGVAVCFSTGFFCTRKKEQFEQKEHKRWSLFKTFSLILAGLLFFRYMMGEDAIQNMFALSSLFSDSSALNLIAMFLVWFTFVADLILILFGFFNLKRLVRYSKFVALPIMILNVAFLWLDFNAVLGADGATTFTARGIVFALEIGFALGYAMLITFLNTDWKKLFAKKQKSPKSKTVAPKTTQNLAKSKRFALFWRTAWIKTKLFFKNYYFEIFAVIVLFLAVMPSYTLQAIFGQFDQATEAKNLSLSHRIIIYIGIIIPVILHYSLRNKDFKERKFFLLFICLGTLLTFSFTRRFESFLDPTNWPLHLCNTAMYIMPLVLIFNMKRFFYFTYFINVLGAFLAMLMPNYAANSNLFSSGIVNFYVNHFIAFFMPLLFVSLQMFPKPKLKQFIYSMLGFLGYFVLVLILNAVFNGLYLAGIVSKSTDFFFINSDFIADKLGQWAEDLRKVVSVIEIGGIQLIFYPVYQVLFFLVYIIMGLGVWFIYEHGYAIANSFADMKHRKQIIKQEQFALMQKLNGRSLKEPMNPQNDKKLVLEHFSKRYGNSDVYAVKDANLVVEGGDIFGFLGPNGAGKSTIIKTIVGIQPLSSGRIEICGYDVDTQPVESKKQIGYVPDHYALYEKLTGREYINYIADLYEVSVEDRTAIINDLLKRFELEGAFDNQMKTYSHGMKQKIAIMAALVHNPKVWILDEPLTGLDPNSIFQVKECMKEHAKKGNIVFFSSHIIDVVEKICSKIAIIKKGQILVKTTVEDIEKSGSSLEEFYMKTIESPLETKPENETPKKTSKKSKTSTKEKQKTKKQKSKKEVK